MGSGVDSELELGLLAIVDREALHEQRGETGTGTTAKRVENKETLKSGAVVRQFSDSIQNIIDDLLANGVVTTGVVVGRILLASDQLLGVVEALVGALTN